MTVSPESLELNLRSVESGPTLKQGLSPEQELFLFGDQGNIADEDDEFLVWHYKMGFSREWLAQFIPENEVPKEFADNMRDVYLRMKESFGSDPETFGVSKPHPVALALWNEQNTNLSFADRPVLSTALMYASRALENDPDGRAKIGFVLGMLEEFDRKSWNSGRQGGDMSATRFPEPVASYKDQVFPSSLCGSGLLF